MTSTLTRSILLVGSWQWPWYHAACAQALTEFGCHVHRFSWHERFCTWKEERPEPVYSSILKRLEARFLVGPTMLRINLDLIRKARELRPEVVWFYNSTHIFPETLRALRALLPHSQFAQYANDNPFVSPVRPDYWRHFKKSVPLCDIVFAYRHSDLKKLTAIGARNVALLRSYYIPHEDRRSEPNASESHLRSDVVFAGHYEADGRLEALETIAGSWRLRLFGGGWARYANIAGSSPLAGQSPIAPVLGDGYRKAISGAKIALCFLSKTNRDTYTRRNFQIPAMGTFMLSEYSEDLGELFVEGKEAEYFRSLDELIDKVRFYLANEDARQRIAAAGHARVQRDGHDVSSRMRSFLQRLAETGSALT